MDPNIISLRIGRLGLSGVGARPCRRKRRESRKGKGGLKYVQERKGEDIPLKPPPLGRFRRNFGASWGRNVAPGSVLGATLRQVGVKIWLLGHLRGEDRPRGRQGTSKGQGSKNPHCAPGPFWPTICKFHFRFGVPFWDICLINCWSHF